MPHGRPIGAKLFLEGMEVPFIGATLTHTVGQASIAYVDLVPHQSINQVAPRTHVSIHVRNFHDKETGGGYPYILAWEGEVFGFSSGRTAQSRMFTLHCIDYSSYWDNVLAYFFDAQHALGNGGGNQVGSIGQDIPSLVPSGTTLTPTTQASASFFRSIIDEAMQDPDADFLDGLVAVYKKISRINTFYKLADKRLELSGRIAVHSSKALQQLLKWQEAQQWLMGIVSRASGYQSLRSIVQDLMTLIFHDFVSVPFPSRVPWPAGAGAGAGLPGGGADKSTIGNFIFKPNVHMIPPPMCNVFFPDEYSSFQYSRNFFKEPTRMEYAPVMPVYMTGTTIGLPRQYEPESFANFMTGGYVSPNEKYFGDGAMELSGDDPGHYMTPDPTPFSESNNGVRREGQFLTNEEKLKGIWLARESLMPASTVFTSKISDQFKADLCKKIAKYLFYKKRFENRSLQITSHLKMSVVPGFNVLLLDDSDADQNILAYCSSVSHRIYATEGGYTNVTLSYARHYKEEDQASKSGGEPLVPPWFAEHIFGAVETGAESEEAQQDVTAAKKNLVTPMKLNDFYEALLGRANDKRHMGSKALTAYYPKENTVRGAVKKLLKDYAEFQTKGHDEVQQYIGLITSRPYVRCREAFRFLGAELKVGDEDPLKYNLEDWKFNEFEGGFLVGDSTESKQIYVRRIVITKYRDELKSKRGFRG